MVNSLMNFNTLKLDKIEYAKSASHTEKKQSGHPNRPRESKWGYTDADNGDVQSQMLIIQIMNRSRLRRDK